MLRVVVEIVPGGVGKPRELARAEMGNISYLADRSDYVIRASEGVNPLVPAPAWESRGGITGHDRNQTVWALVAKAADWAAAEAGKGRRAEAARDAIANARLEGLEITPETQALVDRYVAGEITIEQELAGVLKRTDP